MLTWSFAGRTIVCLGGTGLWAQYQHRVAECESERWEETFCQAQKYLLQWPRQQVAAWARIEFHERWGKEGSASVATQVTMDRSKGQECIAYVELISASQELSCMRLTLACHSGAFLQ